MTLDLGGLRVGPFTDAAKQQVLAEVRAAALTYGPPVGHTLDDPDLPGERRDVESFDAARTALQTWVAHHGVGFEVVPPEAPVAEGTTVLIVLRRGPFFVVARNRIVRVVDEPDRFGWAYGTLEGHPERGEEAFLVERRGDDGTRGRVTIRHDSAPASWSARLIGPLVRAWQMTALRGYLEAVASHR